MTSEPAKERIVAREVAANGNSPVDHVCSETAGKAAVDASDVDAQLRAILCDVLVLEKDEVASFGNDTGLFGHLPELDSMAVASLFTEMEDRLDIIIEDDDVDGEMLETFGGLLAFAKSKVILAETDGDDSN